MTIDHSDNALAALRDALNRQRCADQLATGDRVKLPWGAVWTVKDTTLNGEYVNLTFEHTDMPIPTFRDELFYLAD
jgi:hypothetical protein